MMQRWNKLFFETKMTWKRVIVFAVAVSVLTAAVLLLPFTADTSFRNLGVSFECWILFALIIIINCEKPLEAGVKTFVFFLISQPLIYLLQVPFSDMGWSLFQYYPRWFIWTVLCFPGGIIAWYVKKDSLLSALILSVATGFLGIECMDYFKQCLNRFPANLLTVVFIVAEIIVLIAVLLKKRRNRILASCLTLAITMAACYMLFFAGMSASTNSSYKIGGDHTWMITAQEGDIGEIRVDPQTGDTLLVTADQYGTAKITVTNESGETVDFVITNDRNSGVTFEAE